MIRIAILMSTYNGETYLREQLDSLLRLKKEEDYKIELIIRDDGSSDHTVKILEEYAKRNDGLKLIKGKNIGWKKSFWELLSLAEDYEFYAYCDQDDIWKDDKIVEAVKNLRKFCASPALYYSYCDIIDENGEFQYTEVSPMPASSLKYLTCLKARGCTMVFNSYLRALLIDRGLPFCFAHDLWTLRVAAYAGAVILDETPRIYYREHIKSATHAKKSLKRIKYSVRKYRSLENSYYYYALVLIQDYKEMMDKPNRYYLEEVLMAKHSFKKKLKCLFSGDFVMQSYLGTVELKLFMLFNYCQSYSYEQIKNKLII